MTLEQQIRECIESILNTENKRFIIFPFGEVGVKVKACLNICYGIEEAFIIDNKLCKYNSKIQDISILKTLNVEDYILILACTNRTIYEEVKNEALKYIPLSNIVELGGMINKKDEISSNKRENKYVTEIGRYSYGSLCRNHRYIKSIGAFCSIAEGAAVVPNHPMNYITTHPMLYLGRIDEDYEEAYSEYEGNPSYVSGVEPRDCKEKRRRITIGNDVWLGKNVIITNGANIGNGVIAGAGTVITKDVPDYAVVVGVPARIIRYRYTPEQIDKLNKIAWWNWSDEQIRERYEDFYLDIESFIKKYYT